MLISPKLISPSSRPPCRQPHVQEHGLGLPGGDLTPRPRGLLCPLRLRIAAQQSPVHRKAAPARPLHYPWETAPFPPPQLPDSTLTSRGAADDAPPRADPPPASTPTCGRRAQRSRAPTRPAVTVKAPVPPPVASAGDPAAVARPGTTPPARAISSGSVGPASSAHHRTMCPRAPRPSCVRAAVACSRGPRPPPPPAMLRSSGALRAPRALHRLRRPATSLFSPPSSAKGGAEETSPAPRTATRGVLCVHLVAARRPAPARHLRGRERRRGTQPARWRSGEPKTSSACALGRKPLSPPLHQGPGGGARTQAHEGTALPAHPL